MTIVALDDRLAELVVLHTEPEKIATGFVFTEGPLWHPRERHFTFSDVRADTMYRWTEAAGATVLRRPSGGSNGNTYDRQGRLITCEHANRRLSRTLPDGTIETVAGDYDGKRLNSPNDVICTPSGDLIFTDPPYGLLQPDRSIVGQELPFFGVFRVRAGGGALELLIGDMERPNGLVISPDGRRLMVCDTDRGHVRAWNVAADGSLSGGAVFAEVKHGGTTGRPDGMKLDERGNLYVAANTAEGVWVFSPEGTLLGLIGLPEPPANIAWGGDNWSTLYATAQTSVYRLPMKVAGQPVFVP
jgi:gluconolactonase